MKLMLDGKRFITVVSDEWGELNWDDDGGQEKGFRWEEASRWPIGWVLFARDVTCEEKAVVRS